MQPVRHGAGNHVLGHAPASFLQAIQGTALRPSRERKLDLQSEHSWCKAQRAASDTGHEFFVEGTHQQHHPLQLASTSMVGTHLTAMLSEHKPYCFSSSSSALPLDGTGH